MLCFKFEQIQSQMANDSCILYMNSNHVSIRQNPCHRNGTCMGRCSCYDWTIMAMCICVCGKDMRRDMKIEGSCGGCVSNLTILTSFY